MKGQTIIAVITVIGGIATAYLTASATSDQRIQEIERKVDVIEEREDNHFVEVIRRLDSIEKKIDRQ